MKHHPEDYRHANKLSLNFCEDEQSIERLSKIILILKKLKSDTLNYLFELLNGHATKYGKNEPQIIKKHIQTCYIKWIFDANIHKKLHNYVPISNIILKSDIDYLMEKVLFIPTVDSAIYNSPIFDNLIDITHKEVARIFNPEKINVSIVKENNFYLINVKSHISTENKPVDQSVNKPVDKSTDLSKTNVKFKISKVQYDLMKSRYMGKNFDIDVGKLILMYDYLETLNELLSLPPPILTKFRVSHECFGSPLNTTLNNYCSAWKTLEAPFGSSGSFFDFTMVSGKTYTISPPADLDLMNNAVDVMLKFLDTVPNIIVIVDMPVWDPESQREYGLKVYNEPFIGINKMKESKYNHGHFVMNKDYKFYNYFYNRYVPVVYTHLFIMSNKMDKLPYTVKDVANTWLNSANM